MKMASSALQTELDDILAFHLSTCRKRQKRDTGSIIIAPDSKSITPIIFNYFIDRLTFSKWITKERLRILSMLIIEVPPEYLPTMESGITSAQHGRIPLDRGNCSRMVHWGQMVKDQQKVSCTHKISNIKLIHKIFPLGRSSILTKNVKICRLNALLTTTLFKLFALVLLKYLYYFSSNLFKSTTTEGMEKFSCS